MNYRMKSLKSIQNYHGCEKLTRYDSYCKTHRKFLAMEIICILSYIFQITRRKLFLKNHYVGYTAKFKYHNTKNYLQIERGENCLFRIILKKKPTNWLDQAKRHATKIRPKGCRRWNFGCLLNSDNCQPEVASDVISGAALDQVRMDVRAKVVDSTLNSD